MIGNQVIMRTYKEIKRNKYRQINPEKEYENDNYLYQTLKRTSKILKGKQILDFQKSIEDLLSFIYKEIQLENDPKIKKIKDENDIFQKEYQSISEKFQKTTDIIFKDIINKYNQRRYKLPNLSYKHNLFKINALIEENNNKLELIFNEDKKLKKKNKYNTIAYKTLAYLKKLHFLLKLLLSKDDFKLKKKPTFSKKKFEFYNKNFESNESIKELKNNIEKLKLLIQANNFKNKENKKTILEKRRSSFISTNIFKKNSTLINPRKATKSFSNLKAILVNKIQNEGGEPESAIETEDKKNDPSYFLFMRNDSNNSVKSSKSANSQIEIKSPGNKKRQEDILYCTPFDSKINCFTKTSKQLMQLKANNLKDREICKINFLNNINSEEKESKTSNLNIQYTNTFSTYKKYQSNNINNRYLNSYSQKISISLKKNINNLNKLESHRITTYKNINKFFHKSFAPKMAKLKNNFFVKTQTLEKKSKSRNNNIFLSNKKSDIKSKTQTNFFNVHYKTQDEYLQSAYKRLKKGNYNNLEELIRKYLKEIKNLSNRDEDFLVSHYNYKNIRSNLEELKGKIEKNDISKKTERIYLKNHLAKRILPTLKSMKEKENNIYRLEKIISSGVNKCQ